MVETVQNTLISQVHFLDKVVLPVVVQDRGPDSTELHEVPHAFLDMVVMPVVVQRQAPGIVQTVEIPQLELALGQGCGHARVCNDKCPWRSSTRLWTSLCSCSGKFPAVPGGASELFIDEVR